MSPSSSTLPTPYASGTRPAAGPNADVWLRARAYIHSLAMACKDCPARSADACQHRCPARGATALDRDLEDAAPPPQQLDAAAAPDHTPPQAADSSSATARRAQRPAPAAPTGLRGRPPGERYGDTFESRTRRKSLYDAVAAHGDIGATARMLPPGTTAAARSNDLAYLVAHSALQILGDGQPRRYRAIPPTTEQQETRP